MMAQTTAVALPDFETYLNEETLPYAFCPGCSHGRVLDQLDAALVDLQFDPSQVVIVSDIGCVGLSDKYFNTHAFHGLHGRSVTYATGIKLANPDLTPIVLMGDGGCGIGGHHLLNAARRNVDVTVLVFNNLNYGMTGGQHSATTPLGARTSTTPRGQVERPLDIAGTVALNGAGFVARTTAFAEELPSLIAQAICHEGFSLVEVWELCVAYYAPNNDFSRRALETAMAELSYESGIVHRETRTEFSPAYRAANESVRGQPTLEPQRLSAEFESSLKRPMRIVIAGAAGQHVRSAATLLAAGGVLCGLWATRRDDYPITVQSGHSVSELILSPTPVRYTGIEQPDVVALLAPDGASYARGSLAGMESTGFLYAVEGLESVKTSARIVPFDFSPEARRHVRKSLATLAVGRLVQDLALYPLDALREAARRTQSSEIAQQNLEAIDALGGSA